jgi:hypothetical protein
MADREITRWRLQHGRVRYWAPLKDRKGSLCWRFAAYSLSDDGPVLPAEIDPVGGRGFGMKIIQALVQQIGVELHMALASQDRGAALYGAGHVDAPTVCDGRQSLYVSQSDPAGVSILASDLDVTARNPA